jgi:hypothetical protein
MRRRQPVADQINELHERFILPNNTLRVLNISLLVAAGDNKP